MLDVERDGYESFACRARLWRIGLALCYSFGFFFVMLCPRTRTTDDCSSGRLIISHSTTLSGIAEQTPDIRYLSTQWRNGDIDPSSLYRPRKPRSISNHPFPTTKVTMPAAVIQPSTVPAKLQYFLPPKDGSRPITRVIPDATPQFNWIFDEHTVDIENVRGKEDAYALDTAGFQFYRRPAKHTSFSNDEEIEKEYYPESIELLKELTGASKVVLFDHTIRRRRPGEIDSGPSKRQPVLNVHVDQTSQSGKDRVFRHLPEAEAKELVKKRFQIINLWRPITHAAWDRPLTLCDFRSVDRKRDLVPTALIYPDREGETYGVKYHPEHRWKYLKGMTTDELVLIKCYDSIEDGSVSILTPHTAFEDPSTPEGSPLRESIELRALVFYD